MKAFTFISFVGTLIVAAGLAAFGQTTAQQVVDQFYPSGRLAPAEAADRRSCFGVYNSTVSGEPAVVMAGYTDTETGAVRVITRNGEGAYTVAYDLSSELDLFGIECEVELLDVDQDAQKEVVIRFSGPRGSNGWLFKWNGLSLRNLTPTRVVADRQQSNLFNPAFYDLTHRGALQIVTPGVLGALEDAKPTREPDSVWTYDGSVYQQSAQALDVSAFSVGAPPDLFVAHFRRSIDSRGPFVFRVVNGDRLGQHRVTSASLTLNDVVVLDGSRLTNATEFVEISVPNLPVENTYVVSLTGDPGAKILVKVSDSTVR